MIQEIAPERLENEFRVRTPESGDCVLYFDRGKTLCRAEEGRLIFPSLADYPLGTEGIYLFAIAGRGFFLSATPPEKPEKWQAYSMQELRNLNLSGNREIFAAYTACHLAQWYRTSRYCGACGKETVFDTAERCKVCPACGNRIYPRINPAVIVGVKNGEKLLITRYRDGFRHNALVAGFCEIGETVEETVRREVMEEVGLKVQNITYYKSQPWGIASDLLMGFYCEVEGDDTIHRDDHELKYAEWVRREEILLQPSDYSLTNEMMKQFRDGKVR